MFKSSVFYMIRHINGLSGFMIPVETGTTPKEADNARVVFNHKEEDLSTELRITKKTDAKTEPI